jgi:hypothetical protein
MFKSISASLLSVVFCSNCAFADPCPAFTGSTFGTSAARAAMWRTDYPNSVNQSPPAWSNVDFRKAPIDFMRAVLDGVRPFFQRKNRELVGTGTEPWWISEWLDYTTSGRESLMGLTKERGPNPGDLSPSSGDGNQVWAVGFYNELGASVLGEVFVDPCNPSLPMAVAFPDNTDSVKFLFTDASPSEVLYLQNAPEYDAMIDAPGSGSAPKPTSQRSKRAVRLLQVDISVKDPRATTTGWVFGTFAWIGPPRGDELFDNLVPVALQWGNDPGVYDARLHETWTNAELKGITYGWTARPYMGFFGRANGPADNIRSSCLSCHAAARTPRADIGLLGSNFNMAYDITDPVLVKSHVDTWFQNIRSGRLFEPDKPAFSTLDYSLQLESAMFRICRACAAGDLDGATPTVCRASGFYNRPTCAISKPDLATHQRLEAAAPPRQ